MEPGRLCYFKELNSSRALCQWPLSGVHSRPPLCISPKWHWTPYWRQPARSGAAGTAPALQPWWCAPWWTQSAPVQGEGGRRQRVIVSLTQGLTHARNYTDRGGRQSCNGFLVMQGHSMFFISMAILFEWHGLLMTWTKPAEPHLPSCCKLCLKAFFCSDSGIQLLPRCQLDSQQALILMLQGLQGPIQQGFQWANATISLISAHCLLLSVAGEEREMLSIKNSL